MSEKESDWRKFSELVPRLRERYLAERNVHLARMLADPQKTETERFWNTEQAIEKIAHTLRDCLDDHRRSRQRYHMALMLGAGIMRRSDLDEFSEELRQSLIDYDTP